MLVDNEEDKKTHRPVAPKDVCFRLCQIFVCKTLFILVLVLNAISVCPCVSFHFVSFFYVGSKETSPLPRQPGSDHKR